MDEIGKENNEFRQKFDIVVGYATKEDAPHEPLPEFDGTQSVPTSAPKRSRFVWIPRIKEVGPAQKPASPPEPPRQACDDEAPMKPILETLGRRTATNLLRFVTAILDHCDGGVAMMKRDRLIEEYGKGFSIAEFNALVSTRNAALRKAAAAEREAYQHDGTLPTAMFEIFPEKKVKPVKPKRVREEPPTFPTCNAVATVDSPDSTPPNVALTSVPASVESEFFRRIRGLIAAAKKVNQRAAPAREA